MDKITDDGNTMLMKAEVKMDPSTRTYVPVVHVKNISGTGDDGEPTFAESLTNAELRASPLQVSIAPTEWAMPVEFSLEENLPVTVDDDDPIRTQIVTSLPTGTNTIGNVGINSALPTGTNTIGNVTVSGGQISEDATANLNPVLAGAVVRTAKAPSSLVAGDLIRLTANPEGSLLTSSGPVATSTELVSTVLTTSGNSGGITNVNGGSITGLITVSAVSGTSPTLDIIMEESYDNGTTWTPVWSANRITAVSKVNIPNMVVLGLRRWSWAVGGTTPSFTVSVVINSLDAPGKIIRNLFDRAINQVSLGSSSAALYIEGCTNLTAFVQSGGGTTAANYNIQVSPDGVNWANTSSNLIALLSSSVALNLSGVNAKWARLSIVNIGLLSSQIFAELRATS